MEISGDGWESKIPLSELTEHDALAYLIEVKYTFKDENYKFHKFLEIMEDYKARRNDTADVIAQVEELFKGHNNLIRRLYAFLPKRHTTDIIFFKKVKAYLHSVKDLMKFLKYMHGLTKQTMIRKIMQNVGCFSNSLIEFLMQLYRMVEDLHDLIDELNQFLEDERNLNEDGVSSNKTTEFEEAISFVNLLEKNLEHDDRVYESLLDMSLKHQKKIMDIKKVYSEVCAILAYKPALLEEFGRLSHHAPS